MSEEACCFKALDGSLRDALCAFCHLVLELFIRQLDLDIYNQRSHPNTDFPDLRKVITMGICNKDPMHARVPYTALSF